MQPTIEKLLTWFFEPENWSSPSSWIKRVCFGLVILLIILWLLRNILDALGKIIETWKKLGFRVGILPEERAIIQRRLQFCKVLESDLTSLAKAENWNDQWFTDLEAEVEIEGRYHSGYWNRLLKKEERGLRRINSLMEAIESSDEQFLLLVGDPGSGKSVALRHLAHQLSGRSSKSRRKNTIIPLYINLKEFPPAPPGGPTVDFVKTFVLDNIRRGDADTAAYVSEHWNEYKENGAWFFFFDSFDEIPAVLHAASGTAVIQQHAVALRQFLEGMSNCRGVVASREFKGPQNLTWRKIRILSLNAERQEHLISKSFLPEEQKNLIRSHLTDNSSKLLRNPLFLTLLCRYVKEENRCPANDHDLICRHIERLAKRDTEYLKRHYQINSDTLLTGAIKLAVCLAESESMSLAPTRDEIAVAMQNANQSIDNIDNLLSALIDVKIARCDVKEAREGDRRVTFSHRRFQETLYVQHITSRPERLDADQWLQNAKWREYTVTLLQTQPVDRITGILEQAKLQLIEMEIADTGTFISRSYGGKLRYFEWKGNRIADLILLLQDGLSGRRHDIPIGLSAAVESILLARWQHGDVLDKIKVLQVGSLMRNATLLQLIPEAISLGPDYLKDSAYQLCRYPEKINEKLSKWIRTQLAQKMILAHQNCEAYRLRAWASRLPPAVGADHVLGRCDLLRKVFRPLLNQNAMERTLGLTAALSPDKQSLKRSFLNSFFPTALTLCGAPVFAAYQTADHVGQLFGETAAIIIRAICIGLFGGLAILLGLFTFKSVGEPLSLGCIYRNVARTGSRNWRVFGLAFSVMLTVTLLPAVAVKYLALWLFKKHFSWDDSVICSAFVFVIFFTTMLIVTTVDEVQSKKRLRKLRNETDLKWPLLLYATDLSQLTTWISNNRKILSVDRDRRSILRLLTIQKKDFPSEISGSPLFESNWTFEGRTAAINALLETMDGGCNE